MLMLMIDSSEVHFTSPLTLDNSHRRDVTTACSRSKSNRFGGIDESTHMSIFSRLLSAMRLSFSSKMAAYFYEASAMVASQSIARAPGSAGGKLGTVCGSQPGSAALVIYAGTSPKPLES